MSDRCPLGYLSDASNPAFNTAPREDQHETFVISKAKSTLDLLKVLCWSLGGAVFK